MESDPADVGVGYGSLPNLLGEVELDASIMDGSTLAAGAVGAVHGYEHVITLARRVMAELPHVMLVGPGAERFAAEIGMARRELLTPAVVAMWREQLAQEIVIHDLSAVRYQAKVREWVARMADPQRHTGTMNFLARDAAGNLASAVSTSGWSWKYPGRLGDSPIIGAGNDCDNRYGAAACQGRGEMAIRCGTARSVVLMPKMGMGPERAGGGDARPQRPR